MADWIDKRIEEVYNRSLMTPEERDFLFKELLKNIGTQTAQQQNLIMDRLNMGDASEATKIGSLSQIGYQGALAAGQGGAAIQKYGYDVNRQAEQNYISNTLGKSSITNRQPSFGEQLLLSLAGGGGQALGTYGGMKLAGAI